MGFIQSCLRGAVFVCVFVIFKIQAVDPLPSWRASPAKDAILHFVEEVTDPAGKSFVPAEERIATFDQDGTLWVEHPVYAQLFFALDRFKELYPKHPEWKELYAAIQKAEAEARPGSLTEKDLIQLIMYTHAGMTVDEFHEKVREWLKKAQHPRFKKPFTDLVYQPMLEVIRFLKDNGFKVYIVSGGGQEFMRTYAETVYGIPPEQVIGSAEKVKYQYGNGRPVLMRLPSIFLIDDKQGKATDINLFIGRRPIAAFGNSDGDREMLEWTGGGKGVQLKALVHHDDQEREYAYGANTKIGTFSQGLMDEAKKKNWTVVSMKKDWKVIFPWQKEP